MLFWVPRVLFWSDTLGHTLDLVISRKEDDLVASCDIGDFVSDHNTILVTLNCSRKHPPRKTITYRNVKSINRSTLGHDISSAFSLPPTCLDDAVDQYNTALKNLMDTHALLRLRSVVDHPNHPWINQKFLT